MEHEPDDDQMLDGVILPALNNVSRQREIHAQRRSSPREYQTIMPDMPLQNCAMPLKRQNERFQVSRRPLSWRLSTMSNQWTSIDLSVTMHAMSC